MIGFLVLVQSTKETKETVATAISANILAPEIYDTFSS